MKSKELKVPDFQRSYVWKLKQASRLIESFLLGLPVPAIFLYEDKADGKATRGGWPAEIEDSSILLRGLLW